MALTFRLQLGVITVRLTPANIQNLQMTSARDNMQIGHLFYVFVPFIFKSQNTKTNYVINDLQKRYM